MASMDFRSSRGGRRIAVGPLAVLIVMMWSGVCTADVLNPSFELMNVVTGHGAVPTYWRRVDHPSFNSYCTLSWRTDGIVSAALLSRLTNGTAYNFIPGDYQAFWQDVDLTGIGRIKFDVQLVALPSGDFDHFEAALYVGSERLWVKTVSGVYLDQEVDVSHVTGWRCVGLRLTARDSGTFSTSYWAQWDNIRLVEGAPSIPADIDLDPDTLNVNSNGQWVTCYIELEEAYDPADIDGATVKLEDIPANDGNVIIDHDGDGLMERMVKFEGAALRAIVQPPQAALTVTGQLVTGMSFEGSATLRVIDTSNTPVIDTSSATVRVMSKGSKNK